MIFKIKYGSIDKQIEDLHEIKTNLNKYKS